MLSICNAAVDMDLVLMLTLVLLHRVASHRCTASEQALEGDTRAFDSRPPAVDPLQRSHKQNDDMEIDQPYSGQEDTNNLIQLLSLMKKQRNKAPLAIILSPETRKLYENNQKIVDKDKPIENRDQTDDNMNDVGKTIANHVVSNVSDDDFEREMVKMDAGEIDRNGPLSGAQDGTRQSVLRDEEGNEQSQPDLIMDVIEDIRSEETPVVIDDENTNNVTFEFRIGNITAAEDALLDRSKNVPITKSKTDVSTGSERDDLYRSNEGCDNNEAENSDKNIEYGTIDPELLTISINGHIVKKNKPIMMTSEKVDEKIPFKFNDLGTDVNNDLLGKTTAPPALTLRLMKQNEGSSENKDKVINDDRNNETSKNTPPEELKIDDSELKHDHSNKKTPVTKSIINESNIGCDGGNISEKEINGRTETRVYNLSFVFNR